MILMGPFPARIFWGSMGIFNGGSGGSTQSSAPAPAAPLSLSPLSDFVPIDLEEWWAQQFLAKIENCS